MDDILDDIFAEMAADDATRDEAATAEGKDRQRTIRRKGFRNSKRRDHQRFGRMQNCGGNPRYSSADGYSLRRGAKRASDKARLAEAIDDLRLQSIDADAEAYEEADRLEWEEYQRFQYDMFWDYEGEGSDEYDSSADYDWSYLDDYDALPISDAGDTLLEALFGK